MKHSLFTSSVMTSLLVFSVYSPISLACCEQGDGSTNQNILAVKYDLLCSADKVSKSTEKKLSAFIEKSQNDFETAILSNEVNTVAISEYTPNSLNLVNLLTSSDELNQIDQMHLIREKKQIKQTKTCEDLLPVMKRIHNKNMMVISELNQYGKSLRHQPQGLMNQENPKNIKTCQALILNSQAPTTFSNLFINSTSGHYTKTSEEIQAAWVIEKYKLEGLKPDILDAKSTKNLVYQYVLNFAEDDCEDQVAQEGLAINAIQALDSKIKRHLQPQAGLFDSIISAIVEAFNSPEEKEEDTQNKANEKATKKDSKTTDILAEILEHSLNSDKN